MRLVLGALLASIAAQQPPVGGPATPAPAPAEAEHSAELAAEVAPYRGSVSEGLAELRDLAEAGQFDEARVLAERLLQPHGWARLRARADERTDGWSELALAPVDPLLERLGWNGPPEASRAEIHHADGVAAALAGAGDEALDSFGRAAALAGPGTLRLEATYDRGALLLAGAEALRAQIPELQGPGGALATPPVPPPQPGAAADDEPPDFLKLARRAYRAAKQALLERLRADWRDEDTRANLELIQRRLKELDELERQREEQQDQQEKEPGEESEDGEPSDEEQEGEPSEDSEGEESSEQEGADEQEEPEPDEQPGEQPEGEEESETPEQQEGEENEAEEQESAPEDAQPSEEEERVLTREEVLRLLDRLREIDEEAEALRARLRQRGRVAVEKDW